jgi:hypothetical protein
MSDRVLVWIDVMGRRMQVPMSPKDAAWMRRGAAQARARKAARTRTANAALAAYKAGQGTAAAVIEAISARLGYCSSHERLTVMLTRLGGASREIFWPVFCDYWSTCDATWWLQAPLLNILRTHAPAILSATEQKVFDALPERVRVFRGSSRERVAGLSWSTERRVAERFAHGHRGIPVPDPIVATGIIAKTDIFITNADRNEHEVLLDPDRLQGLLVEPWQG